MRTLRRTQIYLKPQQARLLKQEAVSAGVPVSEVIRGALDEHLARRHSVADWQHDPLMKLAGFVKAPIRDAAARHDTLLYGKRRSRR